MNKRQIVIDQSFLRSIELRNLALENLQHKQTTLQEDIMMNDFRMSKNFLKKQFIELTPSEYIKKIFSENTFVQSKNNTRDYIGNILVVDSTKYTELQVEKRARAKTEIIHKEEISQVDKKIKSLIIPRYIVAPATYVGRSRTNENATHLFAFTIDVDYISSSLLDGYINHIRNGNGITPNIITLSGSGMHLWYLLDQPIRLNRFRIDKLNNLKKFLTQQVEEDIYYYKEPLTKIDSLPLLQGFTMPGSMTKTGKDTVCSFLIQNQKYSLNDLNNILKEMYLEPKKNKNKSFVDLSLTEYDINFCIKSDENVKKDMKRNKKRRAEEKKRNKRLQQLNQENEEFGILEQEKHKRRNYNQDRPKEDLYNIFDLFEKRKKKRNVTPIKEGGRFRAFSNIAITAYQCGFKKEEAKEEILSFYNSIIKPYDYTNPFTEDELIECIDSVYYNAEKSGKINSYRRVSQYRWMGLTKEEIQSIDVTYRKKREYKRRVNKDGLSIKTLKIYKKIFILAMNESSRHLSNEEFIKKTKSNKDIVNKALKYYNISRRDFIYKHEFKIRKALDEGLFDIKPNREKKVDKTLLYSIFDCSNKTVDNNYKKIIEFIDVICKERYQKLRELAVQQLKRVKNITFPWKKMRFQNSYEYMETVLKNAGEDVLSEFLILAKPFIREKYLADEPKWNIHGDELGTLKEIEETFRTPFLKIQKFFKENIPYCKMSYKNITLINKLRNIYFDSIVAKKEEDLTLREKGICSYLNRKGVLQPNIFKHIISKAFIQEYSDLFDENEIQVIFEELKISYKNDDEDENKKSILSPQENRILEMEVQKLLDSSEKTTNIRTSKVEKIRGFQQSQTVFVK